MGESEGERGAIVCYGTRRLQEIVLSFPLLIMYTAAPWTCAKLHNGNPVIETLAKDGTPVQIALISMKAKYTPDYSTVIANARLIAAAPELMECLIVSMRTIVDALRHEKLSAGTKEVLNEVARTAAFVISKAECDRSEEELDRCPNCGHKAEKGACFFCKAD